jgi:hypothetical protein
VKALCHPQTSESQVQPLREYRQAVSMEEPW